MITADIKELIPQRSPILLVDSLVDVADNTATTRLTVRRDNCLVDESGRLLEAGLLEHIAQSVSALAGYKAVSAGASEAPVGYIGEVRKFRCLRRPCVGEQLTTVVTLGAEAGGITIASGETSVLGEVVASTQLKIFIQPADAG